VQAQDFPSRTGLILLALVSAAVHVTAAGGETIVAGDKIEVTTGPAPVKVGEETLTTVKAGTTLEALKVRGPWVKVSLVKGSERITGWIHRGRVSRVAGKAAPDAAPGTSPDVPVSEWRIEPQPLAGNVADKRINVLMDNSHDLAFAWLFGLRNKLRWDLGYRVTSNQATLSSILHDRAVARQRDQSTHRSGSRPFVWAPVSCQYHVALIYQGGARQPFLAEEVAALEEFMRRGSGVILVACSDRADDYPLRELIRRWGAELGGRATSPIAGDAVPWPEADKGRAFHAVSPAKAETPWEPLGQGKDGKVVACWRRFGKGALVVVADGALLFGPKEPRLPTFDALIRIAAVGRPADAAERVVPWEHGYGGGAFWPEKEFDLGGVKVVYAANQRPGVVAGARERLPEVRRCLDKLLPSPPWPGGSFYIILAAGSPGSGWAVNVLSPKTAGITCDESSLNAICSVAAHELAHTMTGPPASDGTCVANWPPFFSEAHAGYLQRLVGERMKLGANPPWWNEPDAPPPHFGIDLNKDSGGQAWDSVWWVWRQIDMKHDEGWYPRWLQRVYERGAGKRANPVDLEVIIQTTSQAVGADVRPIFDRIAGKPAPKP